MRTVHKDRRAPRELIEYRLSRDRDPTYDDFDQKPAILEKLIKDQAGLCCYCMGSLNRASASIEHWQPQSRYPDRQLDWRNLFAVCPGNAGTPPRSQHCDELKADRDFRLDPCDPDLVKKVGFNARGEVVALVGGAGLQGDIDNVIGLNRAHLIRNRNSALQAMKEACDREDGGQWSPEFVERQLRRLVARDCRVPYCAYLSWWLMRRQRGSPRGAAGKRTRAGQGQRRRAGAKRPRR